MEYKDEIIKMINKINDDRFLKFLYMLIKETVDRGVR
jgi:hypothetical protein